MTDSRLAVREFFHPSNRPLWWKILKIAVCTALALLIALVPEYAGLEEGARWALFILLVGAGFWSSEAMPAFAVGLLVIGLEIAILGRPGGVFAEKSGDWERFIVVWGSPLIWLFFGGFILAAAAEKTGLTVWLARNVLRRLGPRPALQLLGSMAVTFVFSMFISNTATSMMMVAVLLPLVRSIGEHDRFGKGLLLGVAFAANLGGMGTVIGSPPNAIAAGALQDVEPIDFASWILIGLPPALLLLVLTWAYILWAYPSKTGKIDVSKLGAVTNSGPTMSTWRRVAVILVFVVTIGMWLTSAIHGVPATVISFIPICVLTSLGILKANDIRAVQWDVLLLIAGGLSLGVAVTDTGLADWLVAQLPLQNLSVFGLALVLTFITALMSNLMSNTAAANILVPIAIAASMGFEGMIVVPIALGASAAMCLPISTPPNAIAYGTGKLETKDLLRGGLLIGVAAPPVVCLWCLYLLG